MYLGQEEHRSDHVGGCRVSSGDQKDERWPRPLDIFSSLWHHLLPWSPCSLLWWTELPGEASSSQGDGEEDPVPTTAQRYRIRLFPYRVSSDICHPHKARGARSQDTSSPGPHCQDPCVQRGVHMAALQSWLLLVGCAPCTTEG